ncbi:MAG: STAS domain-containing protein [Actinomycetota bacterium]|nr:STAS domain-containing protein [Actinomycetota bacterium]MDQ6948485.1 STAS domain-containing protein [Actinomycetota bacterium]
MTDFALVVNRADEEANVVVSGELDMYTAPRLRQELVGLVAGGARQVTVDLGAVNFVDSTALGVLVGGLKRLRQVDGDLTIKSPTPGTLKVLELTGLTKIFTVTSNHNGATPPPEPNSPS